MTGHVLDQVQLGVPVRSADSFQALVRWKLGPVSMQDLPQPLPADPRRLITAR
jgi:hypothetical protein